MKHLKCGYHLRCHVLQPMSPHGSETDREERGEDLKPERAEDRNEWQMEREREREVTDRLREKDGGWKQEEFGRKLRNLRKQTETGKKSWRWDEPKSDGDGSDKRVGVGQRSVSACAHPPLHPSTSCSNRKRLRRHFFFLLRPINNLICCHMIMLRPGARLPSLLNSNEWELFFWPHPLQWVRFIKRDHLQDGWRQREMAAVARSTCHTDLKRKKSPLMAEPRRRIYILNLIQFYNNHKGQLLFSLVSFYFKALQVSEVV